MRSAGAQFLKPVEAWWECPSCGHQHKTVDHRVITPMHTCPQLRGIDVPLVRVYTNAGLRRGLVRHVAVERGDWVGKESGVRTDGEGRAVMAVNTERSDGSNDTHVFAPAATAKGD